jgi:hypothetical protein
MWQDARPETLPYPADDNGTIPSGYKPVEKIRKGFVIAGSIVFGVFYLGPVYLAALSSISDNVPYGALFVPVIGPFIVAGTADSSSAYLYVFDGLIQAGGGAMLLAGLFAKKKVLVRDDLAQGIRPEFFVGPRSIGMKVTF